MKKYLKYWWIPAAIIAVLIIVFRKQIMKLFIDDSLTISDDKPAEKRINIGVNEAYPDGFIWNSTEKRCHAYDNKYVYGAWVANENCGK